MLLLGCFLLSTFYRSAQGYEHCRLLADNGMAGTIGKSMCGKKSVPILAPRNRSLTDTKHLYCRRLVALHDLFLNALILFSKQHG